VVSIATKRRKETLEDEIKLLKLNQFDNPQWVEQVEKHYMGLPINTTALDNISEQAGYGCQDLHDSLPLYTTRQIHLIIDDVKTTVTKTGKNPGQEMCFVTGHDATGKVDRLPIFPELYATLKDDLFPPQMFCLTVHKGKGGWFVKEGYKLDTTRDSGKMQLSD
jgi:DNA polymerase III alpha subunit